MAGTAAVKLKTAGDSHHAASGGEGGSASEKAWYGRGGVCISLRLLAVLGYELGLLERMWKMQSQIRQVFDGRLERQYLV